MTEFGIWPGTVGFEIRGADVDGSGVVCRSCEIEGSIDLSLQARIVEGVILGIASDSDMWLSPSEASQIVQKIVGESVW